MANLKSLLETYQINQRSDEWYKIRQNMLTASDCGSALECNPYQKKIDLLIKKCIIPNETETFNKLEITNNAIKWGIKYEPVACNIYEKLFTTKVYSLGLLIHPEYKWLGASSDGITKDDTLLEIKCIYNRKIQDIIPENHYYWIQCQIQMEVCNIDLCNLFECKFTEYNDVLEYIDDNNTLFKNFITDENGNVNYWKLEAWKKHEIVRDKKWFNNNIIKLQEFWNDVLYFRKFGKDKLLEYFNEKPNTRQTKQLGYTYQWNEWVGATTTRNFILNDKILDWLNLYGEKNLFFPKKNDLNFYNFIQNKGVEFEKNVIALLKSRFNSNFIKIGTQYEVHSTKKYEDTIQAMKDGIPIIYHGILHNIINKTYGIPDLIVRSDWINKIIKEHVLEKEEMFESAKNFGNNKYHYVIVEIKYSKLYIKNNKNNLKDCQTVSAYKSQVGIYTEALNIIQGYYPKCGFLLGRNWTSNKKNGRGCFDKLGVIEFKDKYGNNGCDYKYIELNEKAINWIRDLTNNKNKWENWEQCKHLLQCNMSNRYDYPWHCIKKEIAKKTGEITRLWSCGTKERNIAINKNKRKWQECDSNILEIKSIKRKKIVDTILSANSENCILVPKKIINNINEWKNKNEYLELYVDFENVNDLNDDFSCLPKQNGCSMIFMIGMGYIENNEWIFKNYLVKNLNKREERKILQRWLLDIDLLKKKYNKKIKVWHWSQAEVSLYNKVKNIYNLQDINWADLLQVFKKEPIGINGSLKFGLKNIANALYKNGSINTKWEDSEIDGMGAMVTAWNSINNIEKMNSIIKYNEIDCKVLWEILYFLRNKILL